MRADTAAHDVSLLYAAPLSLKQIVGAALILDLNSDLGISTLSGNVSTWVDQSARVNTVTQATAGTRPAYIASVLDGHAALRCVAATNKNLARVGTFTGLAPGDFSRAYVICAITAANVSGAGGPFEIGAPGTSGLGLMFPFSHNTHLSAQYAVGIAGTGGGAYRTGLVEYTETTPLAAQLYDISVTAGTMRFAKNNVSKVTQTDIGGSTADPLTSLIVGSRYFTNFDGDLFRVVVVNPAPTVVQHAQIVAYFRAQYPSLGL